MFYETAPFLLAAYLTVPSAADCWQGCTASCMDMRFALASPQTTRGVKEKVLLQLNFFKMHLTFKCLWHSQTGSFTNAWQLHSYLFLGLSNTLQKAVRSAKKQDYHVSLSFKKQRLSCHVLLLYCW